MRDGKYVDFRKIVFMACAVSRKERSEGCEVDDKKLF